MKELAETLALESRAATVEAVAAEATPVPVGNPLMTGVASVGLVPNTAAPEPVSSVIAEARLALDGVPSHVAMPAPRPDTPVEIGRPVALVRVAEDGVPKAGVASDGEVAKTRLPVPVAPVEVTPSMV